MNAKDCNEQQSLDHGRASSDIFPLPLTPIELCWLLEDCPSYPMQFFLRLKLDGTLNPRAFERAVAIAVDRHPLLDAVVKQSGKRRWEWVRSENQGVRVEWGQTPWESLPVAPHIDIRRQPGLHVIVGQTKRSTAITLVFQHVTCDGLGAADFVADLLTAYANELEGEQKYKFKRLEPGRLVERGNLGLSRNDRRRWLLRSIASLLQFRRFYKRIPLMLVEAPQPDLAEHRKLYPEALFLRLTREESLALQQRARKLGSTVNTWLLRGIFESFARWRRRHQPTWEQDLIRITMPINMRKAAHRSMPAANVVSLVCIDHTFADAISSEELLSSLDAEMERIGSAQRGLILPTALQLLRRWPNQLAKGIRRKRFSGSALVTNLGPVLANCHLPKVQGKVRIGEVTVEQVEFLPVLRPGHCATMAINTYAGTITIGMHYDSRMVSASDAQSLFDEFVRRAECGSLTPSQSGTQQRPHAA